MNVCMHYIAMCLIDVVIYTDGEMMRFLYMRIIFPHYGNMASSTAKSFSITHCLEINSHRTILPPAMPNVILQLSIIIYSLHYYEKE